MKYFLLLSVWLIYAAHGFTEINADQKGMQMKFETKAFKPGQPIPKKYTCEGQDVSPALMIGDVPPEAKSLVLIVDDPDAPSGTFDHWIVWNIPPETKELPEGGKVPNQGKNGFGDTRYRGPCPPPGKPHRYFFKLYALETKLNVPDGSSKAQVEKAMQGQILQEAKFFGTYQR